MTMNAKRWVRATGFADALAVTGAAFAQESPNTYYAYPASRSAWQIHFRSDSREQPTFSAIELIAAHCEPYSP